MWASLSRLLEVLGVSKREQLYSFAKLSLGRKLSGHKVPVEFGCVEALTNVVFEALGFWITKGTGTWTLYDALNKSYRFTKISIGQAKRGDIILCVTGQGDGRIPNGHVGIFLDNGKIASNDSSTGEWTDFYDFDSWNKRYAVQGGFPLHTYRIIV